MAPVVPRLTSPLSRNWATTYIRMRLGTAKAMPSLPPPPPDRMEVLIPISRPRLSSSGPPELPEFTAASVWI